MRRPTPLLPGGYSSFHVPERLLRDADGAIGSRYSRIRGDMDEQLGDVRRRRAGVARGAYMQLEFLVVAEPGHQRERQQGPGAPVEMRPGPDPAPGSFRNETLEIAVEIANGLGRARDMRFAEHLLANDHSRLIGVARLRHQET